MKYFYLIGLVLIGIAGNAQSTKELNVVDGFSIFKFGTITLDTKDIQKDSTFLTNGKRYAVYHYSGDCLKSIFNVQVSDVSLCFYQDQLAKIVIKLGANSNNYTLEEFNRVQQAFEAQYGKHTGKLAMSGAVLLGGFRWHGKKHLLEHTRFTSTSKKKSGRWTVGELSFENKELSENDTDPKTR